jgi:hypothetical protein
MVERGYYFSMFGRIGLCVITCKCEDLFFEANGICFFLVMLSAKKIQCVITISRHVLGHYL